MSERELEIQMLVKDVDGYIKSRLCECEGDIVCWRCVFEEDLRRLGCYAPAIEPAGGEDE